MFLLLNNKKKNWKLKPVHDLLFFSKSNEEKQGGGSNGGGLISCSLSMK
jgi:hypothetical protein